MPLHWRCLHQTEWIKQYKVHQWGPHHIKRITILLDAFEVMAQL